MLSWKHKWGREENRKLLKSRQTRRLVVGVWSFQPFSTLESQIYRELGRLEGEQWGKPGPGGAYWRPSAITGQGFFDKMVGSSLYSQFGFLFVFVFVFCLFFWWLFLCLIVWSTYCLPRFNRNFLLNMLLHCKTPKQIRFNFVANVNSCCCYCRENIIIVLVKSLRECSTLWNGSNTLL